MRKKFFIFCQWRQLWYLTVKKKQKKQNYCFSQQVYNWDADQKLLWFLLMLSQCVTESYWANIKFTNINGCFLVACKPFMTPQ